MRGDVKVRESGETVNERKAHTRYISVDKEG